MQSYLSILSSSEKPSPLQLRYLNLRLTKIEEIVWWIWGIINWNRKLLGNFRRWLWERVPISRTLREWILRSCRQRAWVGEQVYFCVGQRRWRVCRALCSYCSWGQCTRFDLTYFSIAYLFWPFRWVVTISWHI